MQVKDIAFTALSALVVAWILDKVIQARRHAAQAKAKGCLAPILGMDSADRSGLTVLVKGLAAIRNQTYPDWMLTRLDRTSEKYGRTVSTIQVSQPFFRSTIYTIEPQNLQAVLATQFKDFGLGIGRTENFAPLLGNGIFAANGKQWEHSRALLRPQFTRAQVSDLEIDEKHVQALMRLLENEIDKDQWTSRVDLKILLYRLTLDSSTEFLYGESINSQATASSAAQHHEESLAFAEAMDAAQLTLAATARTGKNYWLFHGAKLRKNINTVHSKLNYFVAKALDRKRAKAQDKYVFIDALAEQTQDPVELRSQLLNILLAGRDTTAGTLCWFFFTMGQEKHTSKYQKLRSVILETFGTYSSPKDITFEALKRCQYLQWCINEILRLYPPVAINARQAMVDTTLPTGGGVDGRAPIYCPKGTEVSWSPYVMHRRKDLWGEDAREFNPERWRTCRPQWEYLSFNGGPRICIGQQFALTTMGYVLVRLIQRIDLIDGSELGPEKHGLTLTNSPGGGVHVRLHFVE